MTIARYNVPTYGDGKIAVSIFASTGGNLMESGEQKRKPGGKVANVDLGFAAECKRKREELGATIESFWKTLGVAKAPEAATRAVSEAFLSRRSDCTGPCTLQNRPTPWTSTAKMVGSCCRCWTIRQSPTRYCRNCCCEGRNNETVRVAPFRFTKSTSYPRRSR